MATICAECEQHIGTQGGGMDQAIALLATKGKSYVGLYGCESENVELLMRYSEDAALCVVVTIYEGAKHQ